MTNYFISFGTRVNEYQVWNNVQIVYRSQKPAEIADYFSRLKDKELKLHFVPPADTLEKMVKEALKQ